MTKPIIAVSGATGLQGGSVVKFLLEDPEKKFAVRALTRNTSSPAAKALAAQGAEVVAADFYDPATVQKVFEGVHGVFGNTNFWDPSVGAEGERKQGKILADAAKAAGVKHFVWSTLDRTDLKVPHFESKADVDDYLKKIGVPTTSLYTAWYFENIANFPCLVRDSSGKLHFKYPHPTDGRIDGYSVQDTGAWVLAAFKDPQQWIGKDIRVVSEVVTPRQVAKELSNLLGEPVSIAELTKEEFLKNKEQYIEEFYLNHLFFLNYPKNRDAELTTKLYPARKTLAQTLPTVKEKIVSTIKSE